MKNKRLKIKVCGMRRREDVKLLVELQPDFIGYIFYPPSPRYVGDKPDSLIFELPGKEIIKTGVFVNDDPDRILKIAGRYGLDALQLHGEENPETCNILKREGYVIIKALKGGMTDGTGTAAFQGVVDYLLYDTPSELKGGSGKKFDWSGIKHEMEIPFLLSGGIGPGDETEIANLDFKQLAGVDINSRFELEPGVKNIDAIKVFINNIRNGNR